eukprot:CAMPEP_0198130630 /NCGR_PEP_ID=MMETSP1442-20131203/54413_1 /TAXON_ID= /ORGANISM="Craspedostauros australis, Strain CCMP3328" /LENGTH=35 /DNA_ID= /DNA_START= /DNA_END= /DNA_ORIENTATION=
MATVWQHEMAEPCRAELTSLVDEVAVCSLHFCLFA